MQQRSFLCQISYSVLQCCNNTKKQKLIWFPEGERKLKIPWWKLATPRGIFECYLETYTTFYRTLLFLFFRFFFFFFFEGKHTYWDLISPNPCLRLICFKRLPEVCTLFCIPVLLKVHRPGTALFARRSLISCKHSNKSVLLLPK